MERKTAKLILFILISVLIMLSGCGNDGVGTGSELMPELSSSPVPSPSPSQLPAPSPTPVPTPEPTPEPTPTPEEQYYADFKEITEANCTRTLPELVDPEKWNENGKALMEKLSEQYHFQYKAEEGYPYFIAVNRSCCTVTVFTTDDEGYYTVPYAAMICSDSRYTPLIYSKTRSNYYPWRPLFYRVSGQIATQIWKDILFHSVPYCSTNKNDIEYADYNKLGTYASAGCIRLELADNKWIYDNCPIGTPVVIYDDETDPGPMGKPGTILIDEEDEVLRGWDPTDPDPDNPWDDKFVNGTAIRSFSAWEDWTYAQENGIWNDTIPELTLKEDEDSEE